MASLSQKIQDWVNGGLITAEQADAVLAFEKSRKSALSPLMVLVFLGVFSIACGIVALVSSHWLAIPAAVKLTGMFALMAGCAFATGAVKEKHPVIFEAGLLLNMLLFFAAIGLVGQVYHLKSDTYKAFLFWSGLSFPLLFLTRKVFFGLIWMPVFIGSVLASPAGEELVRILVRLFPSGLAVSFACFILYVLLCRVKKAEVFIEPLRLYSVAGICLPLLMSYSRRGYYAEFYKFMPFFFVAAAVAFSYAVWRLIPLNADEKKAALISTVCFVLFMLLPKTSPFVLFLCQLTLLFSLLHFAYRFKRERLARLFTLLVALRILLAFFNLFGSLMMTGFGLIFAGGVILAVSFGWYKANAYVKKNMKEEG